MYLLNLLLHSFCMFVSFSVKEAKKIKQKMRKAARSGLMEETIPAMVTIKRVVENENSLPTVTITLKGSTPDQDKLLYTLVNGNDSETKDNNAQDSDKKKGKNQNTEAKSGKKENSNGSKKKNKSDTNKSKQPTSTVITKELKVTLAVDPTPPDTKKNKQQNINNKQTIQQINTRNSNGNKQEAKVTRNKDADINIPMLKLPPGNKKTISCLLNFFGQKLKISALKSHLKNFFK